jgi:hypothetical protein
MAFTITRYRASNPGTGSRGYDITAGDGDTSLLLYGFSPRTPWVPDSWNFESTDGTGCVQIGRWRGQLTSSSPAPEDLGDTFTVIKIGGIGSGGAIRLTLAHLSVRP